jgi:maltooligosyltrehalose trehalohydrolase
VNLDVVYNHFDPSGNYIPHFSPHYVSKRARDSRRRGSPAEG